MPEPETEQQIQQAIRLSIGGPGSAVTVWRNNTGALRDERGRLVTYGLCKGSADLIGFRRLTITKEMVGQQLAQFVAIEVKTGRGRPTPEQANFLAVVAQAGGVAGVARSVEDAWQLLA